jgi:hypothetical protein
LLVRLFLPLIFVNITPDATAKSIKRKRFVNIVYPRGRVLPAAPVRPIWSCSERIRIGDTPDFLHIQRSHLYAQKRRKKTGIGRSIQDELFSSW